MDAELYTEVFSSTIEDMKILCKNKTILQFDNDPKYKSLNAY